MTGPLLQHPILQYAYVVPDLDEGIRHWVEVMGAGPFYVLRNYLGNELTYRGQPSETRVHYAFGQAGPAQIQLIAQDDPGESIYRDMFAPGEGGFHHVCALVPPEELDAQVARFTDAGFEIAGSMLTSQPAIYIDTRSAIGGFTELYGRSDRVAAFFETVRSAHEGWDGVTDPLRERTDSSSR